VGPREIITIDGPAGAGKSTVGRLLAQSLGYLYVDSGALYRAVAWQARRLGVSLDDPETLKVWLAGFAPEVTADARGFHLVIDGAEVTEEIRSAAVSRDASLATRAERRRQDWPRENDPPPLAEIMAEIAARDLRDSSRSEAPLRVPADASVIDTTDLSINEVLQQCLARIKGR